MIFKCFLGLLILLGLLTACSVLTQPVSELPMMDATPLGEPVVEEVVTLQAETQDDSTAAWNLVERSIKEESDQPSYKIDARWPNLEGDPVISALFNVEIDRRVNTAVSDFLEILNDPDDTWGEPPPSTLGLDYDLTIVSDGLVSVYLMFDTYIALSAHPFPSSRSLNFDLDEGRFLTLADLFESNVDPLAVIHAWVEPDLLARDLGYSPNNAVGVLEVREHWNLLPEGLRINFDVYEVGPYAAGHQTILIPWDDLAPYLAADGPVSALLAGL